ncbi:MAG: replication initiation protein RepC [Pseudomonadota bacterium]|nr:replication initiation protein RepC [Pseudomonadota bacterium]
MQTESALAAQWGSYAGAPTGFRRLTRSLVQADRAAERFDGLPDGVDVHGQLLAAFKVAAPQLGLSVRLIHALDWLFRFTRPQDWEEGGRPVVWPSSSMQQEAFGLSESRVKSINRGLIEAGLITMKDSPNGKRYGVRDRQGRIVEAYGFDLSPIAARHAEFVRLAAEAKAERELVGRLRRRATIARKSIAQILETVAEYGFGDEEWSRLRHDTQALIKALRRVERPEEIAIGVASLERRQTEGRRRLEQLLNTVNPAPKGPENKPHNTSTNPVFYSDQNTVVASKGCNLAQDPGLSDPAQPVGEPAQEEAQHGPESEGTSGIGHEPDPAMGQGGKQQAYLPVQTDQPRTDSGVVMRISIDELMHLAPRLRTYLKSPRPAWPEIVDAADWLRGELGVTKSLWGEACVAMGREQAAIAVGIVSAKPAEHFRSTPGGYFHGMVAKAKAGELNLARTIWGLRQAATPKSHRTAGRAGGLQSSRAS